jgi:hypothetical protein
MTAPAETQDLLMVHYLLDTNTASYAIKGNVARVRERLLTVPMADILWDGQSCPPLLTWTLDAQTQFGRPHSGQKYLP